MLEKFERYPLTFGPTHIEKLARLSAHLGGKVEIYAKREDCNSGLAFGGNKLRKLEYIIPDAIASDADTLVSIGGVQSNHTRTVAAVAAKLGMKCRLVQETWVPHEDAVYDRVGNILLPPLENLWAVFPGAMGSAFLITMIMFGGCCCCGCGHVGNASSALSTC